MKYQVSLLHMSNNMYVNYYNVIFTHEKSYLLNATVHIKSPLSQQKWNIWFCISLVFIH